MAVTRKALVLVAALVLVLVTTGCVGSGKTARLDTLDPFPAPMQVATDTTGGCREGESGFDYRFLVVGPADLDAGGVLAEHIRSRGFYRTGLYLDDLPWVTAGYQHRDYPIRVEVGPLERYLADQTPHTGPPAPSIPDAARKDPGRYVLVALRPTDFACTTPL